MPHQQPKIILGIETSCDETSAAVLQMANNGVQILSNIVASSQDLQAKYGGVVPEQAAREQLASIIPVIKEALSEAFPLHPKPSALVDAIAVTQGPGLIGSLLVGVESAKVLAKVWDKALVPVNHLLGHFYANWITDSQSSIVNSLWKKPEEENYKLSTINHPPSFPILGLLVSGGHTDLILMTDHGKYQYLGGTRDDAAGEAFDKGARLLGLPYPGGPQIAKLAETGNPNTFKLPRPMIDSDNLDFSFSGLKTSISNMVYGISEKIDNEASSSLRDKQLTINEKQDLAASIQEAIVDVLVAKTIRAGQTYGVRHIMLAGGVAANRKLAERLTEVARMKIPHVEIHIPLVNLCTDNAAYIAAAAFFNYHPTDPLKLQANPNLSLSR